MAPLARLVLLSLGSLEWREALSLTECLDLLRQERVLDLEPRQVLVSHIEQLFARQIQRCALRWLTYTLSARAASCHRPCSALPVTVGWGFANRKLLRTSLAVEALQVCLYVQEVTIQDAIYGVILGNIVSLAFSFVSGLSRVLLEAVRATWAPILLVYCLEYVFQLNWPRCEEWIEQSKIRLWLLRNPECSLESRRDWD